MQSGKIDPSRIRPAKTAKQADDEATCIILVGGALVLLILGCCCGAGIVGTLWAVNG